LRCEERHTLPADVEPLVERAAIGDLIVELRGENGEPAEARHPDRFVAHDPILSDPRLSVASSAIARGPRSSAGANETPFLHCDHTAGDDERDVTQLVEIAERIARDDDQIRRSAAHEPSEQFLANQATGA
jgi:hypothetical protein